MVDEVQGPDKAVRLQALRARLQALERGGGTRPPLVLGLPALDAALSGGLPLGCLHEVAGAPGDGAALGFCAALLGRLVAAGPVLWCQPQFDLYAPGLAACGLDPARLVVVTVPRPADRLWALEEGLRCRALAAVLGEIDSLDLTAARRLQLAAETSGVTGFVLNPEGGPPAQSVAATRWRVTATPAGAPIPAGHGVHRSFLRPPLEDGDKWLGPSRWQVELLRCRGGRPGRWLIEWTEGGWRDATDPVALAAALRDRPDPPAARA